MSSVSYVLACVHASQAHMTSPSAGVYVSRCFLCFTAVHANQRDLIFLLDGSYHVGETEFPYVRDFVADLVNSLDVGSDSIRVGLVQFSDTPVTEFSLDTYQTKSDLLAHVRRLQPQGGAGLNTGSALSYVRAHHFTEAGGSRIADRVPQLLLLLTAGQAQDAYLPAANALAREGVLTFCVGASRASKAELEQIAFNPSLVYLMDDFSSLPALPQQLVQPLTTYVSGGVEEVPLSQPGNAPCPPAPAGGPLPRASRRAPAREPQADGGSPRGDGGHRAGTLGSPVRRVFVKEASPWKIQPMSPASCPTLGSQAAASFFPFLFAPMPGRFWRANAGGCQRGSRGGMGPPSHTHRADVTPVGGSRQPLPSLLPTPKRMQLCDMRPF